MPTIVPADFDDARVKALLVRHLEGMHANSPPGHVFALDWSGLQRPDVALYAAWDGEDLLGFGALKELGPHAGEIKSMRTADAALGRGVGKAMLDHIVATAQTEGMTRLSLETGSTEQFAAANRLYEKEGFERTGPFGGYADTPFTRFFTRGI